MPRRRRPETREIVADPVYNSTLAEKFVNSMMWDGKKAVSQKIFYDAMDKIKERSQDDPLKLFKKAVENCKPLQFSTAFLKSLSRSEEHTSELQSRRDLVCRLLLEKKK